MIPRDKGKNPTVTFYPEQSFSTEIMKVINLVPLSHS